MIGWLEQNKGITVVLLTLVTLFGGIMVYTRQPDPPPLEIITLTPTATHTAIPPTPRPALTDTPAPLRVYITGQVKNPDVYYLKPGSIIKEAIAAAGGPTDQADLMVVNQAQELLDQQQITIPAKADNLPTPGIIEGGEPPTVKPEQNQNAPANQSDGLQANSNGKININTADLTELTTLSGIGPVIGQRIIDYRTENGHFIQLEDLMQVRGIGPATFAKVKDFITVNGK